MKLVVDQCCLILYKDNVQFSHSASHDDYMYRIDFWILERGPFLLKGLVIETLRTVNATIMRVD